MNKERFDVLSIPDYVTVPKSAKTKMVIVKLFWKDGYGMSNTASLCQILDGLKNKLNNMTHLHWKIIPTWLHLKKEGDIIIPGIFSE